VKLINWLYSGERRRERVHVPSISNRVKVPVLGKTEESREKKKKQGRISNLRVKGAKSRCWDE